MTKHIITAAVAIIMAFSASAQHEHMHIYRKDNDFHTFKSENISSINYIGTDSLFSDLEITSSQNNANSTVRIPLSVIDSCALRINGIPDLYLSLVDYPNRTDIFKDAAHTKSTVYKATVAIDGNGMFDDLALQEVELTGRGNSTWNLPKTPYKFKMAKKASVCNLPKAKSFALIANFYDCSHMRNAVALWVARWLNMPFTNHTVPVNLYFNNKYRGLYFITEKIGIGSGSVNIDETKGLLFEVDTNYDEDFKFKFTWSEGFIPVQLKDPDINEIAPTLGYTPEEYWNIWQQDFTKFANAIVTRTTSASLTDVLDLNSLVDYLLVYSLAKSPELNHPKSLFIYKESLGDVYKFGPVWDFDWAFTFNAGENQSPEVPMIQWNGDASGASFFKHILNNKEFKEAYKNRWNQFVTEGYPQLKQFMAEYAAMIEPSAKRNGLIWNADPAGHYESSWEFKLRYEALCNWIERRIAYCNQHRNLGLN